jgi:hypothetical protein
MLLKSESDPGNVCLNSSHWQVCAFQNEGILFVMSERIGWMPGSKSGFSVSHKYTEIKIQKIR